MRLRDALSGKLTKNELLLVPRAYDIIGDIAVIEIPAPLHKHRMAIAKALLAMHPRIKTVCSRSGERKGDFRLRDLEVLLGEETVTEHKEHGCRFRLDVKKAYFSAREGTERLRIARQVRQRERVLVMFSGVCPFPIVIAKKQKKVGEVYGIELNPDAHEYALENVRINRAQAKVKPILGDVRKACPKLRLKFDRILMPLPKGAHKFLDVAFKCVKRNGIIHLYHWDSEQDLYSNALKIMKREAKKAGKRVRILNLHRVLPYGPRLWKICIDFKAS